MRKRPMSPTHTLYHRDSCHPCLQMQKSLRDAYGEGLHLNSHAQQPISWNPNFSGCIFLLFILSNSFLCDFVYMVFIGHFSF